MSNLEIDLNLRFQERMGRASVLFDRFRNILETRDPRALGVGQPLEAGKIAIGYYLPNYQDLPWGKDEEASYHYGVPSNFIFDGDGREYEHILEGRNVDFQFKITLPEIGNGALLALINSHTHENLTSSTDLPDKIYLTQEGDFVFYWKRDHPDESLGEAEENYMHSGLLHADAKQNHRIKYIGPVEFNNPKYDKIIDRIFRGTENLVKAYSDYVELLNAGFDPREPLVESPCFVTMSEDDSTESTIDRIESTIRTHGLAMFSFKSDTPAMFAEVSNVSSRYRRDSSTGEIMVKHHGNFYYNTDLLDARIVGLFNLRVHWGQLADEGWHIAYLSINDSNDVGILVKPKKDGYTLPEMKFQAGIEELITKPNDLETTSEDV